MEATLTVGERIRRERLKKHLSMEALGAKLGVGRSAINKWEKGRVQRISRSHLIKMSKIFGCDPAWLGGYKDNADIPASLSTLKEEDLILLEKYRRADSVTQDMVNRLLAYQEVVKDVRKKESL